MRYISIILLFVNSIVCAQTDFSEQWQDLYSYNNVKDFTILENKLVAITENAMFLTDLTDLTSQKFSSVNGLSGSVTSCVDYDESSQTTLIGYQNGLVELISDNDEINPLTGVRDHLILTDKQVNGFYVDNDYAFVFGEFGILELNIEDAEFGDSYKLNNQGGTAFVNDVLVANSILYAATDNGLFSFDLNSGMLASNFDNWSMVASGVVSNITTANNKVFFSKGSQLYTVSQPQTVIISTTNTILKITVSDTDHLVITNSNKVLIYSSEDFLLEDEVYLGNATSHNFSTSKAIVKNNSIYMASSSYGVLFTLLNGDREVYTETHPSGPRYNNAFRIKAIDNKKLITYGGYNFYNSYNANNYSNRNIDILEDNQWSVLNFDGVNDNVDLTTALAIPNTNKTLVASYNRGVLDFEDYTYNVKWNSLNTSGFIPRHAEVASGTISWVTDLVIDNENQIWASSARPYEQAFFSRFDVAQDQWVEVVKFPALEHDEGAAKIYGRGVNKMFVDDNNYIYLGTHHNGVLVIDANPINSGETRRYVVLNDENIGLELSFDSVINVISVVADDTGIWIGTENGLYVLKNYGDVFSPSSNVQRLIIEEDGIGRELLSDVQINEILVDEVGNKWFATQDLGLFYTSSDGQTTFNIFNTSNSPLPSNDIIDLELDAENGLIYIVTEQGVLAYDSQNEPYGDTITEVIAYPNPAVRNIAGHEEVTIVSKDGEGIPDGTNVKIMDVSGKLVYETNVGSGDQSFGGKIVWDKKNLSGNYVVSGVYIVLLSSPDGTETTTTKIAIVN